MVVTKTDPAAPPPRLARGDPPAAPAAAPPPRIRVWLAGARNGFGEALARLLEGQPDLACERRWPTLGALLRGLEDPPGPDVLLAAIDSREPAESGLLPALRSRFPAARVIVLSDAVDPPSLLAALAAGAEGYLLKSSPAGGILEGIREVHGGGACLSGRVAKVAVELVRGRARPGLACPLTERERLHLKCIVRGLSKKEIASELSVSFHTADFHFRNLYRKLGVRTRSEAVAQALQRGWC